MGRKISFVVLFLLVTLGVMFIAVSIAPDDEFEIGARMVGIVLGVALICAGMLPTLARKRAEREQLAEQLRLEQERASQREAELHRSRKCPNCGGISAGPVCEYCGLDIADA